jgi:ABC-2 type transport system ATP-binding protein
MVEAVRAAGATALLSSHVITDIEQACDRLIVLGKGHTLLDLSVAEALAHHRVVEGSAPEAIELVGRDAFVGAFPAPAGEPLTLVRTPVVVPAGTPAIGRSATLEEVVIGHLAAGRRRAIDAAAAAEAAA